MPALATDHWFDGHVFRREPVVIHWSRGVITSIAPASTHDRAGSATNDGSLADARGRVVLPGLVDAHAHIARAGFFEAAEPPLQVAQIVRNFQGALRAGVTTVADMGCTVPLMRRLRHLTDADPLAGPRFVGAGPVLTASEGYPFVWISELWRHAGAALAVDDERAAARAVGDTVERGMDHIKVAIMHESFARAAIPALTAKAARAVVREAEALGRRVFAHAHSNLDYEVALGAGVHALMHSSFDPLTPELVARIADRGIAVNPTLWAYEGTCQVGRCHIHRRHDLHKHATPRLFKSWSRFAEAYAASGHAFPAGSPVAGVDKIAADQAMRIAAANLRLLADAGVPIAFGNDASFGVALLSRPFDELEAMHKAGVDHLGCLRAATSVAADLLGRSDLGRIAVGAAADLVIADAAVTHDLAALDVDRPATTLDVIVRGEPVPQTTSAARVAKIAAAYVEGTAATLAHTLGSYARSRVQRWQRGQNVDVR